MRPGGASRRHGGLRQKKATERAILRLAQTPADRARGAEDTSRQGTGGRVDETTGEFYTYGMVNITTLGEGFRVRGA